MPSLLDMQVGGGFETPTTSDVQEQSAHASSPTTAAFKSDAKTVTMVIGVIFVLIYALHVAERMIKG